MERICLNEDCNNVLDKNHKNFCCSKCHDEYRKGKKISEERRERISKSLIGNKRAKGTKRTEEQREKLSEIRRGKPKSEKWKKTMSENMKGEKNHRYGKPSLYKGIPSKEETKIKLSKANKGKPSPTKGKKMSEKTKNKIRLKYLDRIKNTLKEGEQLVPNWNPKACTFFEEFDRKNNTSGKHARNGGEFFIKELGFWVDYINFDLKIIMEYDEKKHYYADGSLKEKDILRQKQIEGLFEDYKFIRIKED